MPVLSIVLSTVVRVKIKITFRLQSTQHTTCDPGGISPMSLASENYGRWDIVWFCLRYPVFSRFSRTPTCDRQTDRHRQTQGHSIYRASIASRGKNVASLILDTMSRSLPPYLLFTRFSWWRGSVVERRSLAGELSLSCARPAADGRPLTWVSHPL